MSAYPPGGGNPGRGGDWMSKLTTIGKSVGTTVLDISKAGVNAINKALDQTPKAWMKSGTVVQLVSRSTGRCLQILQTADGRLVLDGLGSEGPEYYNAHFTVICEPNSHAVYLHNNFNYIAIVDGITQLYSAGPSGISTPKCRLKVREPIIGGQFFMFESDSEKGRFLAILPTGMLKSALVTSQMENESQFGIRTIYSPLPQATSPGMPAK